MTKSCLTDCILKIELETYRGTIWLCLLLLLTVCFFGFLTLIHSLQCLGSSEDPVRAHGCACWEQILKDSSPAGDGTACAWLPSAPGSHCFGEQPALAAPCQTDGFLPLMNGLNSQQCNFLFSIHLDTGESKLYVEKYYVVWFCPVGFQTSYYIHE